MPSTQSVYVSMSILALTGLVGTGVAIGSGVSMMTMQMADAETQQKTTVAASVKETATRAPRGFAASGN
tara:strand:+ start:85 stop:291 length:207 start_codon:yes stop_codon:yes gene_type:complete